MTRRRQKTDHRSRTKLSTHTEHRAKVAAKEQHMTEAASKRRSSSESDVPAPGGFHSLIVPVDLTPSSDRVLGRLSLLPLTDDVRVTLLHVVPGTFLLREQRSAARDANKALAEEARHLRKQLHRNVRIEHMVKVGAAAKEIAAYATQAKAELIVMSRGGGRALRDAFLGSTAERVVRQARLPVLVVRLAPREFYRRPALALDLDPTAHEVVRIMLRVLPPPRPRVTVIHAFDAPPYQGTIYPSLPSDEAEERKDELRSSATRELAKLLATALAKAKADLRQENGLFWKFDVRYGPPRSIVEKAMKKAETDLLVLGTRGHSGAVHMLLGTVAGDLLRAAKCDVLIVPPTRQ
jgi:nucleotide-binding universal stress UspA family protein